MRTIRLWTPLVNSQTPDKGRDNAGVVRSSPATSILGVLVCLLALTACSSQPATPDPVVVEAAVAATVAAQTVALQAAPPTLSAPADGAVFESPGGVVLSWEWERPLLPYEYYDVRVWREGDPHYGIAWTAVNEFDLASWLSQQTAPGDFYWSVAVVAGEDGQVTKSTTDEAAPRKFTVRALTLPTPTPTLTPTITPTPTPEPPVQEVIVPPGFTVYQYASPDDVSEATVITFGPDGKLYMLLENGELYTLEDRNGDYSAEVITRVFGDPGDKLTHAVGLAFRQDVMYVSDSGRISTLTDSDNDGVFDTLTPIIEGLVTLQYWDHSNNGIAFGPDDKLYIGIGSTTDHGPLKEPLEAVILRMNPDGSAPEVFARGLRNPYDLTFAPNGDLFTADNGPDQFDKTLRYLPPEELNHIRQGVFYGFPDVFGIPPYGNSSEPPITELMPSVGSAGLVYYSADQFPEAYRSGVYIAQWGTNDPSVRGRGIRNGFGVVFVPLTPTADGTYTGDWQPFAEFNQTRREIRPVDVTVGADGALYVLDYARPRVYRIAFTGEMPPTPTPAPTLEPTQAALVARGEEIFLKGVDGLPSCNSCHRLDPNEVAVGPYLRGLSAMAGMRVAGLDAEAYVRQSIMDPNAYIVEGFVPGVMYPDYGKRLNADQIDLLVAYVLSLK